MKLTYWVAEIATDSRCYNVRAKTKKEAEEILKGKGYHNSYREVKKVCVEYSSAFELMELCLSEDGGFWE